MQHRALREYAARRGWTVAMQVKEVGSGAAQRVACEKHLEAARRQENRRSAGVALGSRGPLGHRPTQHTAEVEHLGGGFVSLTEALDLTTLAGRAIAGLLAVFDSIRRLQPSRSEPCDNQSCMDNVCFRFGLFELDADATTLRREGRVVSLQGQPRQVLTYLVRNANRTVSREELRKAVWGDQTFVDFERGLNFCVSQIRSALGDDSANPTYIRTFARQGYRFIAPVESVPSTPAGATTYVGAPSALSWRNPKLHALAIVLLTGMAVYAAYVWRVGKAPKQVPVVAVVRFDNETDDRAISKFSDGLTDNVVERLTSLANGRYAVIGNAQALRVPRDQRDLAAISASLHTNYVILGQVQSFGRQTRILAHLIHMPEQTHVWVARLDGPLTNPLESETEVAQKIADQFARHLASGDTSPFRVQH